MTIPDILSQGSRAAAFGPAGDAASCLTTPRAEGSDLTGPQR